MALKLVDNGRGEAVSPGQAEPLSDLSAVVLLAGELRTGHLRKQSGRSLLTLPVEPDRTVLDCWCDHLTGLAVAMGADRLAVRVLVNKDSGLIPSVQHIGPIELRIEYDPASYRGTAGLLSDICRDEQADARLLVAGAGQVLMQPLAELARQLQATDADFTLGVHPDAEPAGLMCLRAGCMHAISPQGFVDLNEQVLPELSKSHEVRVTRFDTPVTSSIRTVEGYLDALRAYHAGRNNAESEAQDAAQERWRSSFQMIEPGAEVAHDAVLYDSVVLSGARVEPGAILVRSVVCPGGVVRQGEQAVDRLVAAEASKSAAG